MPIKRAKSAPQPVEAIFTLTKANINHAVTATRVDLRRTKSHLVQPLATNTSLIPPNSPWVEREDPFSLAGFFPASHRAVPEDEQWKWLRKEEEEDKASVSSFSVDDEDSVLGELEDELAGETIKGEDKLGVLSLIKLFSRGNSAPDTEDRLLSPYVEDGTVDHESLYLSLCAQRQASSRLQTSQSVESSKMEDLFFPAVDDTQEDDSGDNNWSDTISKGMRLIF